MSTFRTPQAIHLSPEDVIRAQTFADTAIETVDYRDSSQTQKKKIRGDHFVSKLGEEVVGLVGKKQAVYLETLQKHRIF